MIPLSLIPTPSQPVRNRGVGLKANVSSSPSISMLGPNEKYITGYSRVPTKATSSRTNHQPKKCHVEFFNAQSARD